MLWKSLLFVPHESLTHPGMLWPLLAPGWSLNYEMYFYLLFALSLLTQSRWRPAGTVIAITVVYLICNAIDADHPFARFYGDAIVFEFVLGIGLALAWQQGWRIGQTAALISLAVSAVVSVLVHRWIDNTLLCETVWRR